MSSSRNTALVARRGRLLGTYSKCSAYMKYHKQGREFPVFTHRGTVFGVVTTNGQILMGKKHVNKQIFMITDGKPSMITRSNGQEYRNPAGLDPMMATAEVEDGARLFYRNAEANTWGILNVREEFAKAHPEVVKRVIKVYEEARLWSIANRDKLKDEFVAATKLPQAVVAKQIDERTDLQNSRIAAPQSEAILAAGIALQKAGVIKSDVDVKAVVGGLLDSSFH